MSELKASHGDSARSADGVAIRVPRWVGAEVAALLRLGAPMAATQFFIMAMGFLDTAMAGHYGTDDLAGVAIGGNVYWPVFLLMSGTVMAITPIAAQLVGAGKTDAVGIEVRQTLMLSVACSLVAVVLIVNAGVLFTLAGIDPVAADIGVRYLNAAAWGLPPAMVYVTLRYTSEGLGHVMEPMVIVGSALVLNALLNWVLIYGKFGAPELGGEGCGWATAIVMWFEFFAILGLSRFRYMRRTGLWSGFEPPSAAHVKSILKIGVPIGLSTFFGMMLYSIIGFLIGNIGVVPLAAHSIAGHINWATYVIPFSIGAAGSIRVGFFVGMGDLAAAARVAKTALLVVVAYAVVVAVALLALRFQLVAIYTSDPEVVAVAAALILFIAVYQLFDDAQATLKSSLHGYKDTRAPMVISLTGYWVIALPLGCALGFGWFGLPAYGVYGFWTALAVGLGIVAALLLMRLYSTSRNEERIRRLAGPGVVI